MRLFLPIGPKPIELPVLRPLLPETRAAVMRLMADVFTGDIEDLQYFFEFRDDALCAGIEARRGEPGFMLEHYLDNRLQLRGFQRNNGAGLMIPDLFPHVNNLHSQINIYTRDSELVVVATEVEDRGRHKVHEVRFALTDPRFNLDELH